MLGTAYWRDFLTSKDILDGFARTMSVFVVKIIVSNFYFLSLEQQHLVENGLSLNNSTVQQVRRAFFFLQSLIAIDWWQFIDWSFDLLMISNYSSSIPPTTPPFKIQRSGSIRCWILNCSPHVRWRWWEEEVVLGSGVFSHSLIGRCNNLLLIITIISIEQWSSNPYKPFGIRSLQLQSAPGTHCWMLKVTHNVVLPVLPFLQGKQTPNCWWLLQQRRSRGVNKNVNCLAPGTCSLGTERLWFWRTLTPWLEHVALSPGSSWRSIFASSWCGGQ